MLSRHLILRLVAMPLLVAAIAGCATMPVPSYPASVDTTQSLLQHREVSMAVGSFSALAGVQNEKLPLRADQLSAGGADGTFSNYIKNALITELNTAGRFDERSPIRIDGVLLHNEMDAGLGKASATLAIHFTVTRAGVCVYDKSLTILHKWDSSFIGAIAIPAAVQNYVGAVQKLLSKLLMDPDFVRATQPPEA